MKANNPPREDYLLWCVKNTEHSIMIILFLVNLLSFYYDNTKLTLDNLENCRIF